jgi:hypothetical protein
MLPQRLPESTRGCRATMSAWGPDSLTEIGDAAGGDRQDADQALVAALAAGTTKQEAARLIGVGERTIYRRLEDPEFRRCVDQARGELVSRTVGRLTDASTAAVTTLRALLEAESESVRLGACRAILELGRKLRESAFELLRLAELEEHAAGDLRHRKVG